MTDKQKVVTLERRVDCVILSQTQSPSGKYTIFIGEHFVHGVQCYDVGALNCLSGTITRRHYKSKAECLAYWQELCENMNKIQERPEENEGEELITLN